MKRMQTYRTLRIAKHASSYQSTEPASAQDFIPPALIGALFIGLEECEEERSIPFPSFFVVGALGGFARTEVDENGRLLVTPVPRSVLILARTTYNEHDLQTIDSEEFYRAITQWYYLAVEEEGLKVDEEEELKIPDFIKRIRAQRM